MADQNETILLKKKEITWEKTAEVKGVEDKVEDQKAADLEWNERKERTDRMIRNHTYGSMGIGLIPLPVVDFLALTGVQIKLVHKLAKFYGVPFSKERAKSITSSLVSSFIPVAATGPISSMVKMIPVVGQTAGGLTMLATGGACTYALGKVFVQHFESGGTFLDFDPETVKAYFADQFKEGKKFASEKTAGQKG